jgi:hypothetical protein
METVSVETDAALSALPGFINKKLPTDNCGKII